MRDHRKLDAFSLADELVLLTYDATRQFPSSELYGLTSQMRRASVSVAANLVEGCARHSDREFVRFADYAFGSLRELGYYVHLAGRLGLLRQQDTKRLSVAQGRTAAAFAALLRVLRSQLGS